MKLNPRLQKLLMEICELEPKARFSPDCKSSRLLVSQLIECFNRTSSKKVKRLIKKFVRLAGKAWVTRLNEGIAGDKPKHQSSRLMSLNEYLELASENDPSTQWAEDRVA